MRDTRPDPQPHRDHAAGARAARPAPSQETGSQEPPSEEAGSREQERERNRRAWRAVALVLVGAFMALLDTTIVNVALPSIEAGLGASHAALEWVVSGYALAYGLILVPAGRIGDRFGHKPLFLTGLTVFTLASVGCGVAQTSAQLVAARAVQGLGAGAFFPAIAATIQLAFTGRARSHAFGIMGAVIGVSTALGPLLGGLIIAAAGEREGWRWVFLVNLFIGAVELPLAARLLPKPRSRTRRGLDPVGLTGLSAALLLLLVPLVEGQQAGWPVWCFVCFGLFVPVVVALGMWEVWRDARGGDVLFKPEVLRRWSFAAGAVFAVVYFAGFTSVFFTLSILWQSGLARSALASGLMMVPFAFAGLVTAANSHRLSAWLGRGVLVLGCAMVAVGLGLTALVVHLAAPQPSAWDLTGPLLLAGLGNGMVIAPNQDFVLAAVPRQEAGTASGVLGTAQRIGSAIGIAVIGTVLFGTLRVVPGADPVAWGFGRSSVWALLANLGFVVVALVLVLALPRRADSGSRGAEGAARGGAADGQVRRDTAAG